MPDEEYIDSEIDKLIAISKMAKKIVYLEFINNEIKIDENNIIIDLVDRDKEKPVTIVTDKKQKTDDISGLF